MSNQHCKHFRDYLIHLFLFVLHCNLIFIVQYCQKALKNALAHKVLMAVVCLCGDKSFLPLDNYIFTFMPMNLKDKEKPTGPSQGTLAGLMSWGLLEADKWNSLSKFCVLKMLKEYSDFWSSKICLM